jgi:hypothetical protein
MGEDRFRKILPLEDKEWFKRIAVRRVEKIRKELLLPADLHLPRGSVLLVFEDYPLLLQFFSNGISS